MRCPAPCQSVPTSTKVPGCCDGDSQHALLQPPPSAGTGRDQRVAAASTIPHPVPSPPCRLSTVAHLLGQRDAASRCAGGSTGRASSRRLTPHAPRILSMGRAATERAGTETTGHDRTLCCRLSPVLHIAAGTPAGLQHITLHGKHQHGLRGLELWMETFAPGAATPIHRWVECAGAAVSVGGRLLMVHAAAPTPASPAHLHAGTSARRSGWCSGAPVWSPFRTRCA